MYIYRGEIRASWGVALHDERRAARESGRRTFVIEAILSDAANYFGEVYRKTKVRAIKTQVTGITCFGRNGKENDGPPNRRE